MIKLIKIIVIIKQTRMNVHLSQGNKNNPIGAVLVNKQMDLTMNHINHCKYRIWHWNSVYEIVYYRCPILNRQCHFTRSILNVFLEVMFSRLWGCQRNPHRFGWCAGKLSRSAYPFLYRSGFVEGGTLPGDSHNEILVDLYGVTLIGDIFVFVGPEQYSIFVQKLVKSDDEWPLSFILMGLGHKLRWTVNFKRGWQDIFHGFKEKVNHEFSDFCPQSPLESLLAIHSVTLLGTPNLPQQNQEMCLNPTPLLNWTLTKWLHSPTPAAVVSEGCFHLWNSGRMRAQWRLYAVNTIQGCL